MARRDEYESRVEKFLIPIMEENNFELVDVEYVREVGVWYLRAYIDKEGGKVSSITNMINHVMEYPEDLKGKKVVVIGAGLAGTEAACDIAGKDGDVTLVEMCPDILFTANHCLNNDQHLRKMVKDRGVKVEANAKVTNITPTSVTFERDGQTMTLECDTVLNAVGFRPNNQLEDLLDEKYDEVAVIGDAVAPRKILTAIHEGYHAIRVME